MSIYNHPELYAALFPPDAGLPEDVDAWFERALGGPPTSVVEPACGPADWLVRFAARGARVHGFDLSPKMVARARRTLRPYRGTARVADMRTVAPLGEPFDAALNLGGSVGHLASDADVGRHLKAMAGLLRTGGVYLVGLCVLSGRGRDETVDVLEETDPIAVGGGFAAVRMESVFRDHDRGVERIRNIVLSKGIRGVPPAFVDEYDLRLFRVRKLREMIRRAGFRLETVYDLTVSPRVEIPLRKDVGDVALMLRKVAPVSRRRSKKAGGRVSAGGASRTGASRAASRRGSRT